MDFTKILPVFAIATGLALAMATSAFKEGPPVTEDIYYFSFVGDNGEEDNPAQWQQIDQTTYDLSGCNKTFRGCMLATTSVTGTIGDLHPSQVEVNGSDADKSPKPGSGVIEVKNRDLSY